MVGRSLSVSPQIRPPFRLAMLSRSDSFRKRGHHFDALESTSISDTEMLALNCLLTVAWWFNESDNESSQYVICRNHIWFHLADLLFEVSFIIIAFVKERFHNAVEIDILGIFEGYSSLQIWPPQKIFQGRNLGRMT